MTPIQLLEKQLKEYQKALDKSNEELREGFIDKHLNDIHWRNLIPKIAEYEKAINKLKR